MAPHPRPHREGWTDFAHHDRCIGLETDWLSVVVAGMAAVVTEPAEHERLVRTGPRSWVPSPVDVFVRVEPELVTGRELVGARWMYGLDLTP